MTQNIVAYVGKITSPIRGDHIRSYGRAFTAPRRELTDWQGKEIGYCYLASSWPVKSYIGSHMHQIYATVDGVQYTGRGFGRSMAVTLRPCAKQV